MRRLLLLLTLVAGCIVPHDETPAPRTPSSEEVARATLDSTLVLRVTRPDGKIKGSAWVVAPGVVATAKHVVTKGHTFSLRKRDGEMCSVKWVEEHPTQDIALLGFESCQALPIPLRVRPVTEGTRVYVAGHPLALHWSFTAGIVSDADEPKYLFLDAVAEMGNSGGPVVDDHGQAVGMAVAIVADPLAHTWGGITFVIRTHDIVKFLSKTLAERATRL